MVVTPRDCARGKVIGSVVVVVVVDTNFGISQHQGTCAACKRHLGVATGGKLAPAPSNRFNTTGVCSICQLSGAFVGRHFGIAYKMAPPTGYFADWRFVAIS